MNKTKTILRDGRMVSMDDVREAWARDEQRTAHVRAIPAGEELDDVLAVALGDARGEWRDASHIQHVAMAALARLQQRHPDCVEDFAQRLLAEVAPWAVIYTSAIELDAYGARGISELGAETVLRILNASPADIVRAIILALPEKGA